MRDGARGRDRKALKALLGALCALGAALGAARADAQALDPQTREAKLQIWTAEAPLASVLEQIFADAAFDVRVGEDVQGLVSGRLEGTVGDVLEPLLDNHGLTVHHAGSTVWFDRRGRDIVERVPLEPAREPGLAQWAARELDGAAPNGAGRVERDAEGLRVSGTRAFVQETLGRIAAARGALGESGLGGTPIDDPPAALALSELPAPDGALVAGDPAALAGDGGTDASGGPGTPDGGDGLSVARRYRSISDVPGYDTEYR